MVGVSIVAGIGDVDGIPGREKESSHGFNFFKDSAAASDVFCESRLNLNGFVFEVVVDSDIPVVLRDCVFERMRLGDGGSESNSASVSIFGSSSDITESINWSKSDAILLVLCTEK